MPKDFLLFVVAGRAGTFAVGLALAGTAGWAQGGFPPGARPTLLGDMISFTENKTYDLESLVVERDTTILLNGHDLELRVSNQFEARGALTIRAYPAETEPAPAPGQAPVGPTGTSYNPGPGTSGNNVDNGRPGGEGGMGPTGAEGTPGLPAGTIMFLLGPNASPTGRLIIDARGSTGGRGGTGGQGGPGGDGEQGQPGQRDEFGFCSGGGGYGGPAGNGGPGGAGGKGGKGGAGGVVVLGAGSPGQLDWLRGVEVSVEGGPGGPRGEGGDVGPAGTPGWGGAANGTPPFGCESEEVARKGPPGVQGAPGTEGEAGEVGSKGRLLFLD